MVVLVYRENFVSVFAVSPLACGFLVRLTVVFRDAVQCPFELAIQISEEYRGGSFACRVLFSCLFMYLVSRLTSLGVCVGVLTTLSFFLVLFFSHQRIFTEGCTDLPREAIGPKGSKCFSRWSVPVFRSIPIVTCDFPEGGLDPLTNPPLDPRMVLCIIHLVTSVGLLLAIVAFSVHIHLFVSFK